MNLGPVIMWPKTTIFWGAGACAQLNISTTAQQGEMVLDLIDEGHERGWPKGLAWFKGYQDKVGHLLNVLGHKDSRLDQFSDSELESLHELFQNLGEKDRRNRGVSLRQNYDWDALRKIAALCPKVKDRLIMDLFNVIDGFIESGRELKFSNTGEGVPYIQNYRMKPARNCLVMLIGTLFKANYLDALKNDPSKLEPYIDFAQALADLMMEEGKARSEKPISDRAYFLFSYAVVSMNFDPVLLWLLFKAHKSANENPPGLGCPSRRIQLFHDMGCVLGWNESKDSMIYSMHESAVQRLNNDQRPGDRAIRMGKFYYPHGCLSWRECPHCGKVFSSLGGDWEYESQHIFPRTLVDEMDGEMTTREEDLYQNGQCDAIICRYCGSITGMSDIPVVMQSSFKGKHPPFIEEIQRDLLVCLENTKHVVLMGYSLPPDDVIWRMKMIGYKGEKDQKKCTVVVGYRGEDEWMRGEVLGKYVDDHKHDDEGYGVPAINAAMDIFGKEHVRAYTGGIPRVWSGSGVKEKVKGILEWR